MHTEADSCINEWEAFCDELKKSGREILQAGTDMDEVTRADGLRYLGRLMRGGVEKFVEYGDPADPMAYKIYHEKIKWGFDNPDSIYNMATISGDRDYVLTGNRGTVNYFNISTMAMGVDGRAAITSFINDTDMTFDENGNFTLAISSTPKDGDCLLMSPDSNAFMIRQTFNNRAMEKEVEATMRCTSPGAGNGALEVDAVVDNFRKAGKFFTKTGKTFLDLTHRLMNHVNEMPEADPVYMKAMGGDPNYAYFWSSFHVEPGQALLIHLPRVPACDAWNLCLYNYWLESLDFHKATVIINKQNAVLNPDGSLTMVVSMEDPGVANWLNTCGHTWGNIMMRWTKPEEVVAPIPELVQLDSVDWESKLKKWV
ncbi:MAG: hypothetical protein VR73_01055 [Gammaproteobacteria bacterium BRH_c0]|nr:MAG: hypothetical protein VR73_01055 [Gammaproteobacteria bacterium BRH_c0]